MHTILNQLIMLTISLRFQRTFQQKPFVPLCMATVRIIWHETTRQLKTILTWLLCPYYDCDVSMKARSQGWSQPSLHCSYGPAELFSLSPLLKSLCKSHRHCTDSLWFNCCHHLHFLSTPHYYHHHHHHQCQTTMLPSHTPVRGQILHLASSGRIPQQNQQTWIKRQE